MKPVSFKSKQANFWLSFPGSFLLFPTTLSLDAVHIPFPIQLLFTVSCLRAYPSFLSFCISPQEIAPSQFLIPGIHQTQVQLYRVPFTNETH